MLFLFVILLIALVAIINNQYASLKKMDALQQTKPCGRSAIN
ncbi:hypothetical protein [Paenibacillus sp. Y412MC10]|nr:hypothetical protein [Paenibacillus sp. Y412MC10]